MTKSKNGGLSGIPKEQKCSFLIGPVSSWFMPNTIDLWTQPNTKDMVNTTSFFVYGSIGCFCLGEIHHRLATNGLDGGDLNGGHTNLGQPGAVVNRLADVKNDNSRVSCVRFQKSLPFPIVLVLTETGSLLMYDCLLNENLFLFRKSEVLKRFVGLADDGIQNGAGELPSAKRAKFNVTQQLNSCTWPHPNNLFLGITLLNKKTCMLIRLKLNNISDFKDGIRQDGQMKEEIVAGCQEIDLNLEKFTSPICLMESTMLDDKICLVAVAMDDGLITVICVNLEDDRILRTIKLQRHDNQVCSMSLYVGDRRKFPLGLLASVSRDGLVLIWDLENEFYFADYLAIQNFDRNSGAKINWFAIRFIAFKDSKPIYLTVSNVESGLSLLKLPENARSKIRLKELHRDTKIKSRHNQTETTLKHNALIFNIEFDPITQTLISSSLDGNQILWSINASNPEDDIKQQFLIPALLDNARTHMLRHNSIKEDLLCLALGKAGIKFFSIANNLLNSRFDMSPSCSLVARKIAKAKASPTSVAWHPQHEYRLAIGTLEGKIYRADITPRKATLIEAEFKTIKSEQLNFIGQNAKHSIDDALGVEYNPMRRNDCEGGDSGIQSVHSNRPKTDGVYSLCWGPNPASPEDITKSAIYAVGSVSHRLFVYCSCNNSKDNSERITNYLDEFEDTSLPEAKGQATQVAWKSSMDMMALGTTDGRIIIVAYLDESHQERSNHKLFKHLVTIQGHLGTSNVQCIAWHPAADKDDPSYYKIAASSNESPAFVFNLREAILIADVRARLRLEQSNGDQTQTATSDNLHGSYANKLKAHDKAITDIAWNPHEPNQVATCSFDRTCYVWSIDGSLLDSRVIAKFSARDRLFTLDWSLVDEDLIFTSGHDSVVWAWRPSENRHHLVSI